LTLSWLSGVNGNPLKPLGVDEFGQTGNSFELYEHFGIDSRTLLKTAIK
jgi:pyruvate dehydrogenase E1 component